MVGDSVPPEQKEQAKQAVLAQIEEYKKTPEGQNILALAQADKVKYVDSEGREIVFDKPEIGSSFKFFFSFRFCAELTKKITTLNLKIKWSSKKNLVLIADKYSNGLDFK